MNSGRRREMRLLCEVAETRNATQRELSRRTLIALGLTNLLLRRLATQGFLQITGSDRNRVRYEVTPEGLREMNRLTEEWVGDFLTEYRRLRKQLGPDVQARVQLALHD